MSQPGAWSVQFGFGLITCQRYPGDARSDVELYAQALDLAELAEAVGFDSIWVSEHHFVDDAYLPALMPMAAAIAARTTRAAIGTGLVLAPLHDPVRLAEDAAVVDLIAAGRLILGLGLGWREEEFEGFRIPIDSRVERLETAIAVLRQSWGDGSVLGTEGEAYPGMSVTPKPAQPGGPPIWIGALSPPGVRRAGRVADGFMGTEVTPESFGDQVRLAREARAAAGRDPWDLAISLHLPTFAWPGPDAWDLVKEHHHYVGWKYEDMETARGRVGGPVPKPSLTADLEVELRSQIVLGTPDEVVEQVAAYAAAAGGDIHYIARLYWPGMDPGIQDEAIRVFAEEVIPRLR